MNLHRLLELNEGRRSKPYVDTVGKMTIGVGRNLTDRGLSEDEINFLLDTDIQVAMNGFNAIFGMTSFGEVREAAVIDLIFNLGLVKFSRFRRFIAAMKKGQWEKAAIELENSLWYQQVEQRGPRIVQMVKEGRWPWE